MNLSPRVITIIATVVTLVTVVLAVLDHEGFFSGVVVGVLGLSAVVLYALAAVRRMLETRMEAATEQISEMLGGDASGLLDMLRETDER